jgi:hypothetical protein
MKKNKGRPKSIKESVKIREEFNRSRQEIADEFLKECNFPKSENWTGWQKRICVAVPVTGLVRIEWVMARFGQVVPCNWSNGDILQYYDQFSPLGWAVAEARNLCVKYFLEQGFEWLLFIDQDVCLPPDTFLKINEYMMEAKYPVVCGLYFCKGSHPEPLVFRGRGNGFYNNFRRGEKIWVDGIPMGLTLIHRDIMKRVWDTSPEEVLNTMYGKQVVRKVFETPRNAFFNPETNKYAQRTGTEDLFWCDRLINEKVFENCGNPKWAKFGKMKFPFICDTGLFARHIDNSGRVYP